MASAARDGQRSAVYAWEEALCADWPALARPLSLDACAAYVDRVFADLRPGERPPRTEDGRGRRRAFGSRTAIRLPRSCRSAGFVLHEVAHALLPKAGHGPAFARLLLDLLVRYEGVDRLRATLLGLRRRPRRIRFGTADPLAATPRTPVAAPPGRSTG